MCTNQKDAIIINKSLQICKKYLYLQTINEASIFNHDIPYGKPLSNFFMMKSNAYMLKGQTTMLLLKWMLKTLVTQTSRKNFRFSLFFCLKITSSHHHAYSAISQLEGFQLVSMLSLFFPRIIRLISLRFILDKR